jgi:hypothetical protein
VSYCALARDITIRSSRGAKFERKDMYRPGVRLWRNCGSEDAGSFCCGYRHCFRVAVGRECVASVGIWN